MQLKSNIIRTGFILLLTIIATHALGEGKSLVIETDWLEPSIGSTGKKIDARVDKIIPGSSGSPTVIDISIPIENPGKFDAIEVISESSEEPVRQSSPPVWLDDHDKGTAGLRLFLKKPPKVNFRIRLIDNEKEE